MSTSLSRPMWFGFFVGVVLLKVGLMLFVAIVIAIQVFVRPQVHLLSQVTLFRIMSASLCVRVVYVFSGIVTCSVGGTSDGVCMTPVT